MRAEMRAEFRIVRNALEGVARRIGTRAGCFVVGQLIFSEATASSIWEALLAPGETSNLPSLMYRIFALPI
jgi:hypothetical protein